jgi:mediator of replication checkpoint protein 1
LLNFTCPILSGINLTDRESELKKDEKYVQELMNDLQNGGLRRRRGAALDIADWSDDDDEDAEERRRRWEMRREEMKRRMLEDENLGKLGISYPMLC